MNHVREIYGMQRMINVDRSIIIMFDRTVKFHALSPSFRRKSVTKTATNCGYRRRIAACKLVLHGHARRPYGRKRSSSTGCIGAEAIWKISVQPLRVATTSSHQKRNVMEGTRELTFYGPCTILCVLIYYIHIYVYANTSASTTTDLQICSGVSASRA